jgi:hypothetical protein
MSGLLKSLVYSAPVYNEEALYLALRMFAKPYATTTTSVKEYSRLK